MPTIVQALHTQYVYPASYYAHSQSIPTRTALSILDSYTANYTPTGAIWIFKNPQSDDISLKSLSHSLSITLNSYPHFAGRLRMVTRLETDPFTGKQTVGYNRHDIWWGDKRSPGVGFTAASSSLTVRDLLRPTALEGENPLPVWNSERISKAGFLPSHLPASAMDAPSSDDGIESAGIDDHNDDQRMVDKSCLQIQFTAMSCGGFVLGVAMTHVLGDAITLGRFMNDWSSVYEQISRGEPTPTFSSHRIFNPSLVDRVIQTATSHATSVRSLLCHAFSLPMHRYDWFASEDAPFHSAAMNPPPAAIAAADSRLALASPSLGLPDPGKPPPWNEWDLSLPVRHVVLYFTCNQLRVLRSQVLDFAKEHAADEGYRDARLPSTLDVVLAHIWVCINRARGFTSSSTTFVEESKASGVDDDTVFADNTIGLRGRLRYRSQPDNGKAGFNNGTIDSMKDDSSNQAVAESYDTIPAEYIGNMLAIAATGRRAGETCEPAHVPATAFALRRTLEQILGNYSNPSPTGLLPTQPSPSTYIENTTNTTHPDTPSSPAPFSSTTLNPNSTSNTNSDSSHSSFTPDNTANTTTTTPPPLAAHIFSLIQDLTPQRIWQSFLGRRHLLVSSWVGSGMYAVRFGSGPGRGPAFVHPVMPFIDGCVEFMEAPAVVEGGKGYEGSECSVNGGEGKNKERYRHGLDVNVYLAAEAMDRLLADPGLHPTN